MVRKTSVCVVLFRNSLINETFVNSYFRFWNKYADRNEHVTVDIGINISRFDEINILLR